MNKFPAILKPDINMEKEQDLGSLISDAEDFIETKAKLWKFKAVDTASDVVSSSVVSLSLICFLALFVFTFNIGVALLIGSWLGKYFYGFFIIAGLYGISGLVLYAFRNQWLKTPISNSLINKLLK
jgi:hypothetical protein